MVVLEDVPEAIRQVLYENWKLHGSLGRNSLGATAFNTGVPAPSRKYPSIEVVKVLDQTKVMTVEWWQMDALVHVHVWARPKTSSINDLATAKNIRKYLVQQIIDILHKMCVSIRDVEWIYPGTEINADQYHALESDVTEKLESSAAVSRGFFPILHSIIPIGARRFHHKYSGGIPVNR